MRRQQILIVLTSRIDVTDFFLYSKNIKFLSLWSYAISHKWGHIFGKYAFLHHNLFFPNCMLYATVYAKAYYYCCWFEIAVAS